MEVFGGRRIMFVWCLCMHVSMCFCFCFWLFDCAYFCCALSCSYCHCSFSLYMTTLFLLELFPSHSVFKRIIDQLRKMPMFVVTVLIHLLFNALLVVDILNASTISKIQGFKVCIFRSAVTGEKSVVAHLFIGSWLLLCFMYLTLRLSTFIVNRCELYIFSLLSLHSFSTLQVGGEGFSIFRPDLFQGNRFFSEMTGKPFSSFTKTIYCWCPPAINIPLVIFDISCHFNWLLVVIKP